MMNLCNKKYSWLLRCCPNILLRVYRFWSIYLELHHFHW